EVVGVIGPGARAAVGATSGEQRTRRPRTQRRIGVIATESTVQSGAYTTAIHKTDPKAIVIDRACPLFVPLAEEGWVDNEVARTTAALYLQDFKSEGIDTLVLGCTHYPLLEGVIGEAVGPGVVLVDSARATASVVRARLLERGLLAEGPAAAGEDHFFVTDSSD